MNDDTLPPQREGQANTMLICGGQYVDKSECGHWESPTLIQKRIAAAVAAERERCAKAFETEVESWGEMRKAGYLGSIKRKGAAAIRAAGPVDVAGKRPAPGGSA